MYLALAIFSTFTGAAASLLMLILLLASSPNSSPQQLTQIRWCMFAVAALGLVGLIGAIWSMYLHRHGLAAAIGFVPALGVILLFVILLKTQG